jgi:hypothetical protein
MTTSLKQAAETLKSLFTAIRGRIAQSWRKRFPARRRVIELEFRRRSDNGTRRSAAIHVESRSRRHRS